MSFPATQRTHTAQVITAHVTIHARLFASKLVNYWKYARHTFSPDACFMHRNQLVNCYWLRMVHEWFTRNPYPIDETKPIKTIPCDCAHVHMRCGEALSLRFLVYIEWFLFWNTWSSGVLQYMFDFRAHTHTIYLTFAMYRTHKSIHIYHFHLILAHIQARPKRLIKSPNVFTFSLIDCDWRN